MGHILASSGLKPDPHKAKAIKLMPRPTTKQETQSLRQLSPLATQSTIHCPSVSEYTQPHM